MKNICFYDKMYCDEEKIVYLDFIDEHGAINKVLCCKNCMSNKIPNKIVVNTTENELNNKKCPNCQIGLHQILQASKAGCPLCYSFFYEELKILIKSCQNNKDENLGKTPDGMHHKSALVSCILKDLEKEDPNLEAVKELKDFLKNF